MDMLTAGVWLNWRENLFNVQLGAREKIGNLTMLQVAQTAAIEGWACAEAAPVEPRARLSAKEVRKLNKCEVLKEAYMMINLHDYPDVVVTERDSRWAGNCTVGTEEWLSKHFPGRRTVTVGEILTIDDKRLFTERAAIMAVRRHLMRMS
jgi:hypothetical protein